MKRAVLFVLTVGLASAQTPAQTEDAHARKLAEIRRLVTLSGGEQAAGQMMDQMAANLKAAGGGPAAEAVWEEFRREFDVKKLIDIQVASFDRYLSEEDVRAMIAFYQSPAGQRMLAAMPKIMSDMMQQSMEISRELAERSRKRLAAPPPK